MALTRVKNNKPPTASEIKGRLTFAPIMLVIGLAIFFFASIPKLQKAAESKLWDTTQGTITDARIVAHIDGFARMNQKQMSINSHDEDNKFRVDVSYEYQVNGNTYRAYKKHLMENNKEGYSKLRRAKKIQNKFLDNKKVTVYYNPQNPEDALLKPGLKVGQWLLVVSPLIMVLAGILLLISVLRFKFSGK